LTQADETLLGLYRALADQGSAYAPGAGAQSQSAGEMRGRFDAAMDDDFNTPDALAVMQGAARDLNTAKAAGRNEDAAALAAALRDMGGVLGLLQQPPSEYLKRGVGEAQLSDSQVDTLIEARRAARAVKNFAESDRIRDVLASAGIALEDKPDGATGWRRS
jgi:cysteinyl-tRNA synthetase